MRYKLKKLGCYILIIILLPYIVTVFLNGPEMVSSARVEELMVKVQVEEQEHNMSIKEYALGVLASEIPDEYEPEAIKAQAIMVRTKLYKEIQEKGSDTTFTEEFWTQEDMEKAWGITRYANYYNKIERAWDETEGQILLYEGEMIFTPFFRLSNGNTRDGKEVLGKDYPYLKIKDCPLDIEEVEQLQTVTLDMSKIEITSLDTAGYVLKVRVGEDEVNGEEFRKNYKLASSSFSVQTYEGKIRLTTRGVGHGIGLSQNTANRMAENGKSAKEILEYFYEGCEIQEIADVVVAKENKKSE